MFHQTPAEPEPLRPGRDEEAADACAEGRDEADDRAVQLGDDDVRPRQVLPPGDALLRIEVLLGEKGMADMRRFTPDPHDPVVIGLASSPQDDAVWHFEPAVTIAS